MAIIGATISFIFEPKMGLNTLTRNWFVAFVITILLSTFVSALSFFPEFKLGKYINSTIKNENRFMFYKYIRTKYFDDINTFQTDLKEYFNVTDFTAVEKQLIAQIIDLSNIAYSKYVFFSIALIIELISFLIMIVAICI